MGIAVKSSKIITLSDKVVVKQRSTNVEYGYLYNWYAVNNAHGLAPDGWHIASDTEWTTLITWLTDNGYGYGGSGDDVAKSIAYTSGWSTHGTAGNVGNDQTSNNSSKFSGLSGGYRSDSSFVFSGEYGCWWASTEASTGYAWCYTIIYYYAWVYRANDKMANGYSVRCLRNNSTGWNGQKLVDIDGNIYDTVKIGDQIWMGQNLATSRYRDGTTIPTITDNTDWSNDTTGAKCAYNNNANYVFL